MTVVAAGQIALGVSTNARAENIYGRCKVFLICNASQKIMRFDDFPVSHLRVP
jgi:hypothetical protein